MILSTMSIQEVRREIQKELPYLFRTGKQRAKLLTRTRIKKKLPNIRGSFYVNSPLRTRFLIIVECPKNTLPLFLFVALYKDGDKTKAIQIPQNADDDLTVISDHFFYRYSERFCLRPLRTEDVISRYFLSNANFTACLIGDQWTFSFPDGCGLGVLDEANKVFYINTFLSTSMLFDAQAIQREVALENFKQFVDENYPDQVSLRKLLNGDDVGLTVGKNLKMAS